MHVQSRIESRKIEKQKTATQYMSRTAPHILVYATWKAEKY